MSEIKEFAYEVHVNGTRVARFHHNGPEDDNIQAHPAAKARITARKLRREDPNADIKIVKDAIMEAAESDVGGSEGDEGQAAQKTTSRRTRNPSSKKRVGASSSRKQ